MYNVLVVRIFTIHAAGWSSQVARRAHNPEAAGSNPAPASIMNFYRDTLSIPEFLGGTIDD